MSLFDYFSKKPSDDPLEKGIEKTKMNLFSKLSKSIFGKTKIDDEVLDELEEILISSDVGIETTLKIIERTQERVKQEKYTSTDELSIILREEICALITENIFSIPEPKSYLKPYIIMVVGVNGAGKTTTIGKLAAKFQKEGKKVILGAADTFRAAAVDQLKTWGERAGVLVVSNDSNDPASVAYHTLETALKTDADIVLIDTAGRLHTKVNLMTELSKIKRVLQKLVPQAPHEILLVLDGSTGQNAFIQAKEFTKATEITGLVITKLDGTAKGGVVIGISEQLKVPIRYIGVGEKVEDLQVFEAKKFVTTLFSKV